MRDEVPLYDVAKRNRTDRGNFGVDAFGRDIPDPTENVIALGKAQSERQDQLRKAERRFFKSEIARVRAELKAISTLQTVHQKHDYALHRAEQGRLDALRANDREDVKALAIETGRTAETLQAQQTATAKALQESFAAAMAEQNKERRQNKEDTDKRLSALELAQSEGRGKATVESPMMAEMVAEIKAQRIEQAAIVAALSNTSGQKQGSTSTREIILWVLVAGLALLNLWGQFKPH